jgi:tripeptide aminopeptidase
MHPPAIGATFTFVGRLFCALLIFPAHDVLAQGNVPPLPTNHAGIRTAMDSIRSWNEWTLQQQIQLTEIPAPPFKEEVRAAEFKRRLEALGLTRVRIDSEGNVIGERPGTGSGPTIVISGHLDTVFPEGTDVKVKREGTRLAAPGIGDDGRGLAVVLAVLRAMQEAKISTVGRILFVGTVGEEGPGNLRGVRHLFNKELKDSINYFISVDGTQFTITNAAVGSHRYRVSYIGPGGHSYGAFGMPNPIHALGRAIDAISDIQVPTRPKTTFNVGVISGGTSVNSISASGVMDVDLRSESQASLDTLDTKVRAAIANALAAENARWPGRAPLSVKIDTIGIRPAGALSDSAPIVEVARRAAQFLQVVSTTVASSTDANIPISMGIQAITIDGGGRGGGAHALDEFYDDGRDGYKGPQWALLIIAALAGVR